MPLYETEQDLANERMIMNAIAERYGVDVIKCPEKYRMDAVVLRGGKLTSFIEFKRRNIASTKYPTFFISLGKAIAGMQLTRYTGKPVYLVVEWTDMVGRIEIGRFTHTTVGGRKDRGDPLDYELMVHYPVEDFKILKLWDV